MNKKTKRLIMLNAPYVLIGLLATNLGEAWRLAIGSNATEKVQALVQTIPQALSNPLPSLHPFDLMIGAVGAGVLRLAVYLKGKNAKKFRTGSEYGSAKWGTSQDIEPFMDPDFKENVILTKTERLMMSGRPSNPKYARNKNVLVVGGSGSGKTRFFLLPNLLQMHSSYVVTDPNGPVVIDVKNAYTHDNPMLNSVQHPKEISLKEGETKMLYWIYWEGHQHDSYRIKITVKANYYR